MAVIEILFSQILIRLYFLSLLSIYPQRQTVLSLCPVIKLLLSIFFSIIIGYSHVISAFIRKTPFASLFQTIIVSSWLADINSDSDMNVSPYTSFLWATSVLTRTNAAELLDQSLIKPDWSAVASKWLCELVHMDVMSVWWPTNSLGNCLVHPCLSEMSSSAFLKLNAVSLSTLMSIGFKSFYLSIMLFLILFVSFVMNLCYRSSDLSCLESLNIFPIAAHVTSRSPFESISHNYNRKSSRLAC